MKGTIRSEQFDDVYFSVDDGLAETHHVFLAGNDLPERFSEREFVIAETGFGTGLNFLAAWEAFDAYKCSGVKDAPQLRFISFEKYPLSATDIRAALAPWAGRFADRVDRMLALYPDECIGRVDLAVDEGVELCLIFEDVNEAIPTIEVEVDCWFLDGFTPSKNPDMWSDILFEHMGRLTRAGGSFATFTAAGFVKRGLQKAGFEVSKRDGFGRKRDMLVGRFLGENTK